MHHYFTDLKRALNTAFGGGILWKLHRSSRIYHIVLNAQPFFYPKKKKKIKKFTKETKTKKLIAKSPPHPGKLQIPHPLGTDNSQMPVGCLQVGGMLKI